MQTKSVQVPYYSDLRPTTIKTYLDNVPSDELISLYLEKRQALGLPEITLSNAIRHCKMSDKTLKKYRELATLISSDYREERRKTGLGDRKIETPTPFCRYCWEMIHLTKILLLEKGFCDIFLYDEIKTYLNKHNLLTRSTFNHYEQTRTVKPIKHFIT